MMPTRGALILASGKIFRGRLWRPSKNTDSWIGEVVFNTSMSGYQEMLTDPSYEQQILCLTFPVIGVYGTNQKWNESIRIHARGLIVHDLCDEVDSPQSKSTLVEFMRKHATPILSDIDTRSLVLELRNQGTQKGIIVETDTADEQLDPFLWEKWKSKLESWSPKNHVREVSTSRMIRLNGEGSSVRQKGASKKYQVALFDFGVKWHIASGLQALGIDVVQVPYDTTFEQILDLEVDGIVFSNGPGDPLDLKENLPTYRKLAERFPTLGICLGHQLLGLAFGGTTYKLPYGHRGGNHPVRHLSSGRVFLTSQNHGYTLDAKSLAQTDLEITYQSLNDETVEGIKHKTLPIMAVQYHPEHCPGPQDSHFHFQEFLDLLTENESRGRP